MKYPTANIAASATDHESIHGRAESAPQLGLGLLYLLAVPVSAGLSIAEGVNIAGFNYTGWMWVFFSINNRT